MRVLYQLNYAGLGADRWISGGYRDAFESLGHEFSYLYLGEPFERRVKELAPDVLFLFPHAFLAEPERLVFLARLRERGTRTLLFVDHLWDSEAWRSALYRAEDIADIYWGENEMEWMQDFVQQTGKQYVTIPLAANRRLHFPAPASSRYECDVAFLGARMPMKEDAFRRLLLPLRQRYRVRIYGPGWTVRDHILRAASAVLRELGARRGGELIARARISVPPEEERVLYSSAKICVNIHERGDKVRNHVFLNERGFKIPACGGFELCDKNLALRRYFTDREVATAENDADWLQKIDYYLQHPAERDAMRQAATRRAARDHLYINRVKEILRLLGV